MVTIAIDAMGGDYAPGAVIDGVNLALQTSDTKFILVGDGNTIASELNEKSIQSANIEVVHTNDQVEMDEDPRTALESKPESSIALAAKIVAENKADVLVSAGNTGGLILAAAQHIPMLPGIERGALAAVLPVKNFKNKDSTPGFSLLLDVGATIHCEVKHLVHFAIMGQSYVKNVLGFDNPRVGLLNIGSEETKGGHTLMKTHALLKEDSEVNFVGNIEGNDIPAGAAEVIVCEGMLGNVVIKLIEGIAESMTDLGKAAYDSGLLNKIGLALLSPGINKVKKKLDYSEYGGAPILGFEKLCIKAHGRSNAKAVFNALGVAINAVEEDLCGKIKQSVQNYNKKLVLDAGIQ